MPVAGDPTSSTDHGEHGDACLCQAVRDGLQPDGGRWAQ
jgi:hypothetical protein